MTAQSFEDMRMEPRWALKSTVSVFSDSDKEYIGLLVNWSHSGLMISSYQPMPKGSKLEIDLVDIINDDERRSGRCVIEVLWEQELTPSLYGNGCRIHEGSDTVEAMMRDYCDDCGCS